MGASTVRHYTHCIFPCPCGNNHFAKSKTFRLEASNSRHSAEKAKRRLSEDRTPDYGAELARVVDRAVTRIQRLRSGTSTATDGPPKKAL